MSFREKANEVLEQGAKERANYSPEDNSVPLKMYQYWAANRPKSVPPRENFCHYWRVVAIWAPFWFAANKFNDFFSTKTGMVTSIAAIVVAVFALISLGGTVAWLFAGTILGTVYTLAGFIAGVYYVEQEDDDFTRKELAYFTLPGLLGAGVAKGWNLFSKSDKRVKIAKKVGIGLYGLFAGAVLLGLLIQLGIAAWANPMIALYIVGGVVALALVIFGLSMLGSYLKLRHKRAVEARTTYIEVQPYDDWPEYTRTEAVVEPSRFAKFFMSVGDFLNLAVQVVRVKKWKICPIVEIPNG